jgi:hypothetical protein
MTKRRSLRKVEIDNILIKQEFKCANIEDYECPIKNKPFDAAGYELDHIIEIHHGGKDELSNIQALCPSCHRVKTKRNRKSTKEIEVKIIEETKVYTKEEQTLIDHPMIKDYIDERIEKIEPKDCEVEIHEDILFEDFEKWKKKKGYSNYMRSVFIGIFSVFYKSVKKTYTNFKFKGDYSLTKEAVWEHRNQHDAVAKFISECICCSGYGDEVVTKADLRRKFKTWKEENDQKSVNVVDLEKRIIIYYGKYPPGGWTNFTLNS